MEKCSKKKPNPKEWKRIGRDHDIGDDSFKDVVIFVLGEFGPDTFDELLDMLCMTRKSFLMTWKRQTGKTYKEFTDEIIRDLKRQGIPEEDWIAYVVVPK